MFGYIWHAFFFDPVYNCLVFFIDVVPAGDVGLAIVFTTIAVKTVLFPLSIKAVKTQAVMREIEPKLKEIKENIKDKQEQARAMMDLYKESGINPFASVLLMFIQIPIIIALYLAVSNGGGVPLPGINTDLLYSFIPTPEVITTIFLGMFDITAKSLPLAILAGLSQFVHASLSMPKPKPRDPNAPPDMKEDFTRNMHMQMRYVLPVIIAFFAYTISAAIGLYFFVSNVVAIGQEYFVKKHRRD